MVWTVSGCQWGWGGCTSLLNSSLFSFFKEHFPSDQVVYTRCVSQNVYYCMFFQLLSLYVNKNKMGYKIERSSAKEDRMRVIDKYYPAGTHCRELCMAAHPRGVGECIHLSDKIRKVRGLYFIWNVQSYNDFSMK